MGTTTITQSQLSNAFAVANSNPNNPAAAWSVLAQAGDQYAQAAYTALNNPNSLYYSIVNASNAISGVTPAQQLSIEQSGLSGYLNLIHSSPSGNTNYNLPNTTDIETNYANAVQGAGAPLSAAVDLDIADVSSVLGSPNWYSNLYGTGLNLDPSRVGSPSDVINQLSYSSSLAHFISTGVEAVTNYVVQYGTQALISSLNVGESANLAAVKTLYSNLQTTANDANTQQPGSLTSGPVQISSNGQSLTVNLGLDGSQTLVGDGGSINIGGQGFTATFVGSGGSGSIGPGGSGIVNALGSGTSITGGDGIATTVNGQAATIRLGDDAQLTDNTSGSVDTTGGNSQVNIYGDGTTLTNTGDTCTDGIHCAGDTVNGTGENVSVSSDSQVSVDGSNNTITADTGADVSLDDSGNTLYGSGVDVSLAEDASTNVIGSGNTITLSTDDTLGAYGGGNTVSANPDDEVYVSDTGGAFDQINVSDLRDEPFVMPARHGMPGLHAEVLAICRDAGFEPSAVQDNVWLVQTIVGLVAAGIEVALVASNARALAPAGVIYRALRGTETHLVELAAACRRDDNLPVLRAFIASLRDHALWSRTPRGRPDLRKLGRSDGPSAGRARGTAPMCSGSGLLDRRYFLEEASLWVRCRAYRRPAVVKA